MTREEKIALLIDELEDIRCNNFDADTDEDKTLKEVVRVIKALKQETKTGHWEWLTEDKYRCSNCNSETRVDECMNEPMYEFCPFCGAKMLESEG